MTCSDCPAPISRQSKGGRCRTCALARLNADPAFVAARTAGIRQRYTDPAYRARQAASIHAYHIEARKDPVKRERLNRNIWKAREHLSRPEIAEKRRLAVLAGQKQRHETMYAWCPPEYRAEYRRLVDVKNIRAAEAKRMILEMIAPKPSLALQSLTPFERMMQKVRNGAGIVELPPIRRVEPPMSLVGISTVYGL